MISHHQLCSYFNLFKFANIVKCYKAIHNFYDSQSLQFEIDSLFQWSIDNNLFFNINKCVVLKFKPSINAIYTAKSLQIWSNTEFHLNIKTDPSTL